MKKSIVNSGLLVSSVSAVFALALVALPVSAAPDTTVINGTVNTALTIDAATNVDLEVTPVTGGHVSTGLGTVTVTTNNASGYNLTIQMNIGSTSNSLMHTDTTTALVGGTVATVNTWGYSTDPAASAQNDVLLSTLTGTYQAVPVNGSAATIANTSAPATSGDVTDVYYGMSADPTQKSGDYTGTVLLTAVAN